MFSKQLKKAYKYLHRRFIIKFPEIIKLDESMNTSKYEQYIEKDLIFCMKLCKVEDSYETVDEYTLRKINEPAIVVYPSNESSEDESSNN